MLFIFCNYLPKVAHVGQPFKSKVVVSNIQALSILPSRLLLQDQWWCKFIIKHPPRSCTKTCEQKLFSTFFLSSWTCVLWPADGMKNTERPDPGDLTKKNRGELKKKYFMLES